MPGRQRDAHSRADSIAEPIGDGVAGADSNSHPQREPDAPTDGLSHVSVDACSHRIADCHAIANVCSHGIADTHRDSEPDRDAYRYRIAVARSERRHDGTTDQYPQHAIADTQPGCDGITDAEAADAVTVCTAE
jgi:hypothetical protein